jgi:protein-L-isoaspartate(D-aspartate) O-methyltransferase
MSDFRVARKRMVSEQLRSGGISDEGVLAAMGQIPRHLFIPRLLRHRAYQPCALPIGYGQTISQPFTVGLMSALLELRGRENILEIGTGSGYQAAVLSHLGRSVVSIERINPLAQRAASVLRSIGFPSVEVIAGDGSQGLPERGPYDAILVTACASHFLVALLDQLRDGGFLLLPIGNGNDQVLYRYQRKGREVVVERSVACRFVPLLPGLAEGKRHA